MEKTDSKKYIKNGFISTNDTIIELDSVTGVSWHTVKQFRIVHPPKYVLKVITIGGSYDIIVYSAQELENIHNEICETINTNLKKLIFTPEFKQLDGILHVKNACSEYKIPIHIIQGTSPHCHYNQYDVYPYSIQIHLPARTMTIYAHREASTLLEESLTHIRNLISHIKDIPRAKTNELEMIIEQSNTECCSGCALL